MTSPFDAEQLRPSVYHIKLCSSAAVDQKFALWRSVLTLCKYHTWYSMPPRRQPNQAQQQLPSRVTTVRDLGHFEQLREGWQLCVVIYTDVSSSYSTSRVGACDPALI